MAWVADGDLAGAVSNAGGLGIIGGGNAPKEVVKANIDRVKQITDKPFGVNIMLLSPFADDIVDLVIEEGVKVVTTGAGNPGKYMERFHEAGITVIPVIPSVALAKRMEKLGADAVVAEGMEAGGHIGKLTTMALFAKLLMRYLSQLLVLVVLLMDVVWLLFLCLEQKLFRLVRVSLLLRNLMLTKTSKIRF